MKKLNKYQGKNLKVELVKVLTATTFTIGMIVLGIIMAVRLFQF